MHIHFVKFNENIFQTSLDPTHRMGHSHVLSFADYEKFISNYGNHTQSELKLNYGRYVEHRLVEDWTKYIGA